MAKQKPITERENTLLVFNHKPGLWVPGRGSQTACGLYDPIEKGGPGGEGVDGFGVNWVDFIPEPGNFLLKDVTEWKKVVTIPNVNDIDWEKKAERELPLIDRENKFFCYSSGNGPFERFVSLMGFEEALCALYEEPEASFELLNAIVDFKIEMIKKAAYYYHPDGWMNFDDVAATHSTFMSVETYRALIKPVTMRYFDAVREYGMMPLMHCCGHAEALIEDFIDLGSVEWNPIQPMNDIAGMIEKYGDKITFCGGYDTVGAPAWEGASEEVVREDVRRCFREYAKFGRAYEFGGFFLGNDPDTQQKQIWMQDEYERCAEEYGNY